MNITLRQMDRDSIHQVDQFNRNSIASSHLMLQVENNRITYSLAAVEPYEKTLNIDPEDYASFFDNPQKAIFFADVDGKPAGQIKMIPWWNKFAYIDELTVDTPFRGKGVGRALLTRGIEWARGQGFPGVMLETQTNNVPACKMYEKYGFILGGFDFYVYRNFPDSRDETAVYWYLIF